MLRIVSNWCGAKNRHAIQAIHALATGPVVDLFGGTGGVALNGNGILYNDLDARLIGLARAIRDDCAAFEDACRSLPAGGKASDGACAHWEAGNAALAAFADSMRPHEFAWRASFSFAGRMRGRPHRHMGGCWRAWLRNLPELSCRLQDIAVTSVDALEAIEDAPAGVTIYADPPYGSDSSYAHRGCDWDALVAALEAHRGMAIMSGYGDAPEGWQSISVVPHGRRTIIAQGFQRAESQRREYLAWRKG